MMTFSLPDNIIQQLAENDWVVADSLLSPDNLLALKALALKKWENKLFSPASIGRGSEKQHLSNIRGDEIIWLDPAPKLVANLVESLMNQINESLWLGLTNYETHFARYDQNAGYDEHIDQSAHKNPLTGIRVISFILYLNENWQKADAGELHIRYQNSSHLIEPIWGRLVLFKSDKVPHAVLASKAERWSLTGWLRKF